MSRRGVLAGKFADRNALSADPRRYIDGILQRHADKRQFTLWLGSAVIRGEDSAAFSGSSRTYTALSASCRPDLPEFSEWLRRLTIEDDVVSALAGLTESSSGPAETDAENQQSEGEEALGGDGRGDEPPTNGPKF